MTVEAKVVWAVLTMVMGVSTVYTFWGVQSGAVVLGSIVTSIGIVLLSKSLKRRLNLSLRDVKPKQKTWKS